MTLSAVQDSGAQELHYNIYSIALCLVQQAIAHALHTRMVAGPFQQDCFLTLLLTYVKCYCGGLKNYLIQSLSQILQRNGNHSITFNRKSGINNPELILLLRSVQAFVYSLIRLNSNFYHPQLAVAGSRSSQSLQTVQDGPIIVRKLCLLEPWRSKAQFKHVYIDQHTSTEVIFNNIL